jgi:lysophospholipase L1-like esterase
VISVVVRSVSHAVFGVLARHGARRTGAIALAVVAFMTVAGLVPASAANSSPRAGLTVILPARNAQLAQASGTSQPCFYQFPDCSSSNPHVSWGFGSVGDTTSCVFEAKFTWGDGTKAVDQTFSGGADGAALIYFDHDYGALGTYPVSGSLSLVQGSCTIGTGSFAYSFSLVHVTEKLRLAALGDSYSSGEGAGSYYAGTNSPTGCHRSPNAWALQLTKYVTGRDVTLPSQGYLIACSGAVSSALKDSFKGQQPQADALAHLLPLPQLVTITMGGNDLGFSDVVEDCYKHNCITDGMLAKVKAKLPAEQKILESDYVEVHLADKNATILVVGYPRIFQDQKWCGLSSTLHLGFSPAEETALNVLTGEVNAMIDRAASAEGFSFVNVAGALAGHEMCTAHPWLYEIGTNWNFSDQQQAHPTTPGQVSIAKEVAAFINTRL